MFSWIYRYSKIELIVLLQELDIPAEGTLDELRARAREYYTAHPEATDRMHSEAGTSSARREDAIRLPTPSETSTVMSEMRKWGCVFDGKEPISFLERLEELGTGYGFSGQQMMLGISELLKGDSLLWFRNVRTKLHTWGEFQAAFIDQFLPRRYQATLKHELRGRLHKENEPYKRYETDMVTMMRRAGGFSEDEQLLQLYDNLHPSYKLYVRFDDLSCVQDLRHRATEYENVEEQRRALKTSIRETPPTIAAASYNRSDCCWRCKQRGHTRATCRRPAKKFYSQCGRDGVLTRECHPPAGNGRRVETAPAEPRP